jgi:nucleotidyltransferase/DNA polymerase involved in DNA repair
LIRVEELPGLETTQISRLRAAGIRTCRQLLRAAQVPKRLATLALVTELSPEMLESLAQRARLCQIRGVGPVTMSHLLEVGVGSLATLATQEPQALQARLQQRIGRRTNLAVIEDWILQAKQKQV